MSTELRIEQTARRRVAQGESVDLQYARLNAARDKRKKRAERRMNEMLSGGWKQVPLVGAKP